MKYAIRQQLGQYTNMHITGGDGKVMQFDTVEEARKFAKIWASDSAVVVEWPADIIVEGYVEMGKKSLFKKKDRFDLEQEIMACWQVVDEIDLLTEYFGDHPDFKDMPPEYADKIMNLMIGVSSMYSIKFDRMFRTFEQLVRQDDL